MHEIQLEPIAIGYVAVLSVVAALLFGAIPLWRGTVDGGVARKRPRQYRHAAASRHAPPPARRPGGDGVDAAGRVGTDGAERPEPARDRSRIQPRFDPDIQHRPARRQISDRRRRRDGASADHRARAGAAGCDVGVRHHLPAAEHGMQRQHAARRGRRLPGRHAAAARALPRRGRWLLRDHGHAHPARPLARSQRRRSAGTGRGDQPGAREECVQRPGPDRPPRGFKPAAAGQHAGPASLADGGRRRDRSPDAGPQRADGEAVPVHAAVTWPRAGHDQ